MLQSLVISFPISSMQLEMFKAALNNYSMQKLRFLIKTHTFAMYCKNISSPISIKQLIETPNQIFYCRIAPKYG